MVDEVAERLRAAYATGSAEALERWAATGRPGLLLLRELLVGSWDPPPAPGVHPRDLVDNTSALVAEIAAAEPDAFLEIFELDRFRANGLVLTGLGRIDDPRATRRLARVVGSADRWVRMDVAIGLGRRVSSIATATLVRLMGDEDDLVRYHALQSLARIGDPSALAALRQFASPNRKETELAAEAIRSIERRGSAATPPDGRAS
jgi:HEAT repeat protein